MLPYGTPETPTNTPTATPTTSNGQWSKPKPMPVVSRNVPVYASANQELAKCANDGDYNTDWKSAKDTIISEDNPAWLAYDLSGVSPENRGNILAIWFNTNTYPYDHTYSGEPGYGNVGDYVIEANSAAGGSVPTTGWVSLVKVKGNTYHSRQHALDFTGYNWIRIYITKNDGTWGGDAVCINFDIHDASQGYEDDWLFLGDSITAFTMPQKNYGAEGLKSFGQLINDENSYYFPAQECAGIGGTKTSYAVTNIDKWLAMFPGRYVALCYGTNDINGNPSLAQATNDNFEILIKKILEAGKAPAIPRLIWGPADGIQSAGPYLNEKIDALYVKYPQVIKGPDLWNIFKDKKELFTDGLHPNAEGIRTYREAWAEEMLKSLYNK